MNSFSTGKLAGWQKNLKSALSTRTALVYFAFLAIVGIAGIIMPVSVSGGNIRNVLREASLLGIVALGQGLVMLAGGLDISVGNIMFMVIISGGKMMNSSPELMLPVSLGCLAVGAVIGLVNGLGVAHFKISPIIMTLGTSSILFGGVYLFGGNITGSVAPGNLQFLGKKILGGLLPLTSIIWIALALTMIFLLHRTTFGRKVYATGNNPRAAWYAGINAKGMLILSYIICDVLAAAAGLLLLGYLGTPTLRFTDIYTMGSISAVVIGGIEFFSGIGSIAGTIAGALIVRFIFSFLVMMNMAEAGRKIVEGLVILTIVSIYSLRKKSA